MKLQYYCAPNMIKIRHVDSQDTEKVARQHTGGEELASRGGNILWSGEI